MGLDTLFSTDASSSRVAFVALVVQGQRSTLVSLVTPHDSQHGRLIWITGVSPVWLCVESHQDASKMSRFWSEELLRLTLGFIDMLPVRLGCFVMHHISNFVTFHRVDSPTKEWSYCEEAQTNGPHVCQWSQYKQGRGTHSSQIFTRLEKWSCAFSVRLHCYPLRHTDEGVPICCLLPLQSSDSPFRCMDKVGRRMLAAVVSAKPT